MLLTHSPPPHIYLSLSNSYSLAVQPVNIPMLLCFLLKWEKNEVLSSLAKGKCFPPFAHALVQVLDLYPD